MALILDQGDDHAVQVEEEHDEVEAELDEGFLWKGVSYNGRRSREVKDGAEGATNLLVDVEFPEDLRCVQKVGVVNDPTDVRLACLTDSRDRPHGAARRKQTWLSSQHTS